MMEKLISPRNIIDSGLCIGCGICTVIEPGYRKKIRMEFDAYGQYKPVGLRNLLEKKSGKFGKICPFSPFSKNEDALSEEIFPFIRQQNKSIGRYLNNWIGYVVEDDFRKEGSSGGLTSWILTELKRANLIDGVAHVVTSDPDTSGGKFFKYRISYSEKEIKEGAKSRYYPVELSEILYQIRKTPGRYIVVAVPCMIKAIQLLRQEDSFYNDRIRFTAALFCGHMKSARFIESIAWQMNIPVKEIKTIDFRYKIPDRPANWYNAMLTMKNGQQIHKDWWHLSDGDWGAGFFMNSACNFCDDVVGETADFSGGDAWIEPYAFDGKGNNVLIVRSPVIQQLIKKGIKEGKLDLREETDVTIEQTQAAGFRQRREGLAYRLLWAAHGIPFKKRVIPTAQGLTRSRKKIYWMRFMISKWSHRLFWLARKFQQPGIYLSWAHAMISFYYGIAYHLGKWDQIKKRYSGLNK